MSIQPANRIAALSVVGLAIALLMAPAGAVFAQGEPPDPDAALARMYAPVLAFHRAEVFRPQPVQVMVNSARLRRAHGSWFSDINVLPQVSIADLMGYPENSYALDAWYGDDGASDYMNYSAHRATYQAELSPEAAGLPIVTYAHVVRALTARGGRGRAQRQALRQGGLAGWRQARRLYQQCAELAAKKMQRRRRPDEPALTEVERLREKVRALLDRET